MTDEPESLDEQALQEDYDPQDLKGKIILEKLQRYEENMEYRNSSDEEKGKIILEKLQRYMNEHPNHRP